MAAKSQSAIGILFDVLGGGSISGESGKLIKSQLDEIVKQLNGSDGFAKIKISIDMNAFNRQISAIKEKLSTLVIEGTASVSPGSAKESAGKTTSGQAKEQAAAWREATDVLNKYYDAISQVERAMTRTRAITKDGDSVYGIRSTATDAEKQRWQDVVNYANQATNAQREYAQSSKMAALSEEQQLRISQMDAEASTKLAIDKAKWNASAESSWSKLSAKVNDYISRVEESASRDKAAVTQLNRLRALANSDNPQYFDKLNNELAKTQEYINKNNLATETWFQKFKKTFGTRVRSIFSAMILAKVTQAIRDIYKQVVEVDTALTKLSIVTKANTHDMDAYAKSVTKAAKEIGAAVTDLINATTTYARLGFSLRDAAKFAELTTQYSKVADVDAEAATQNITAVIKAYGVGADELEKVIDKLIYVGNNYAISSAEIGEGMNNAASSLKANGNTLEEALGLLASANATMQNISKSSTGLRTIAARLSAATTELDELGESADDLMTTANLDKFMRAFGVSVVDTNGHLRSTYDILKDLSKIWNTLETEEMSAIAGKLAGTRQQAVFYSIMQNFADAESVVANAEEKAEGELATATAKRLDSIQGKLDQLSAAFTEISTDVLDSGLVKGGLDFVTKVLLPVLSGVVKLTNLLGGLKGVLMVIASMLVISKLSKITAWIQGIATKLGWFGKFFAAARNRGVSMTTSLAQGFKHVGVSISAAQLALGAFTLAISACILAFNIYNQKIDESISSLREASTESIEASKSAEENAESVKKLAEEYKELTKAADWQNNTEAVDRVKAIQDEVQRLVGQQAKNLDLVNGKLSEEYNALVGISREQRKIALEDANVALYNAQLAAKKSMSKFRVFDNASFDLYDKVADIRGLGLAGVFGDIETEAQEYDSLLGTWYLYRIKTEFDTVEEFAAQYEAVLAFQKKLAQKLGSEEASSKEFVESYEELQEYINEFANVYESYIAARDRVNELTEQAAEDEPDSSRGIFVALKEIRAIFDQISDGYDGVTAAMEDMTKYGQLSTKTLETLLDLLKDNKFAGLEFSDILTREGDSYKLAEGALDKYIDKLLELYTYNEAFANAESKQNALENLRNLKAVLATLMLTTDEAKDLLSVTKKQKEAEQDALKDQLDRYKDLVDLRKELLKSYQEEVEYNKELDKKTNNVAKLQTRLAMARLDTSTAGQARARQLEEELAEAQDELEDFTLEHAVDTLLSDLDAQYDEYKRMIDTKLEEIKLAIDGLSNTVSVDQGKLKGYAEKVDKLIDKLSKLDPDGSSGLTYFVPIPYDNYDVNISNAEADRIANEKKKRAADALDRYQSRFRPTYHDGGFVGGLRSDEEFAKLLKGEYVSTPAQIKRFMDRTLPTIASSGKNEFNAPLISIQCDNVTRESLPGLKEVVDKAVAQIEKKLDDGFSRTGYKRTTNKI